MFTKRNVFAEQYYPPDHFLFLHIFVPRILLYCGGGITVIGLFFALIALCSQSNCPIVTDGILDIIGGK